MTLTILRQNSKKLKNPSRIIKLALMITYATWRLKRNYLLICEDLFNRCLQSHDDTMSDELCDPLKDCPPETDLGLEDSVSQVASLHLVNCWHARLILIAGARDFELFTPVIWLGRRRMPLPLALLLLRRLTPRPGYELGKQSSKLKKNTLLFLKAAHRWRFPRYLKINFA